MDDNKDSADAMAMLMSTYGYDMRTAYNFESALCKAASFAPHVALLDLSKPEPDGVELAKMWVKKALIEKYGSNG